MNNSGCQNGLGAWGLEIGIEFGFDLELEKELESELEFDSNWY